MDRVTIKIETDSEIRSSEIIADLRTAVEALYYPMTMVGFWDYRMDLHLCPQEERRQACPHKLPEGDPNRASYESTMQRDRRCSLEVSFPHAGISFYLR